MVDVDDRRLVAGGVGQVDVVEPVVALLELPVRHDRLRLVVVRAVRRRASTTGDAPIGDVGLSLRATRTSGERPSMPPDVAAPGAGAGDEELGLDRALVGLDGADVAVVQVEAGHLDALEDADAFRRARGARGSRPS